MIGKATTIWQQISPGVKMSMGARQPVGNEDTGYLHFQVGPERGGWMFKVCVQLNSMDTYVLRLVRIETSTRAVMELDAIEGLYCDDLNETLLRWEGQFLVS